MLNKKGFSLVEVMVVIGISSFILSATYGVLNISRRSWLTGESLLTVQQDARIGLERIRKDVRASSAVTVSVDKRRITFNVPIDADNNGFLDVVAGTNTTVYGADDSSDFDGDGVFFEAGWNIEYQIDADNRQIFRRVLTNGGLEASRALVVRSINVDIDTVENKPFTYFETDTGATGITNSGIIIRLTTRNDSVDGVAVNPPSQYTLKTRVNLRN